MTDTVVQMRWRPSITFGARLRALRLDYGHRQGRKFSQEEFAQVLGLKPSTYSAWETDRNPPTHLHAVVADIEERTGCERGFLLGIDLTDGPDTTPGQASPRNTCFADIIAFPGHPVAA